jgi:hypothetical protein
MKIKIEKRRKLKKQEPSTNDTHTHPDMQIPKVPTALDTPSDSKSRELRNFKNIHVF